MFFLQFLKSSSNISSPKAPLFDQQPLLVPIHCSCNSLNSSFAISYATLIYSPMFGDSIFSVSTQVLQNLVDYRSVHLANPTADLILPYVGEKVVFPISCKCPNSTQQVKYLNTYVFQPNDTLTSIALKFGSTEQSIMEINGDDILSLDAIFIPVSRLPNLALDQPSVGSDLDLPSCRPNLTQDQPFSTTSEKKGVVLGLGIGLGICGLLLVIECVVLLWCCRKVQFKRMGGMFIDEERQKVGKRSLKLVEEEMKLMADVAGCLDKYKVFNIDELRKATKGFDDRLVIKGSVYKGCINGEIFAIKKIKWDAHEELKILHKVNHGNLVRLEGFCIDPKESNCYVENGSLYSWLHDKKKKNKRLSWNTRLRIAIDVANGLQYIHEHTYPKVVHKDIKSSNILLDSNMRAKIASFGLAKSGCNAVTMHIVGTRGYVAPEYITEGVVSTKMDVFSFGVVLLELVSGGEVIDEEGKFLVDRFVDGRGEGKLREWMDESVNEESCTMESVMKVMGVAMACLDKDPTRRPNMMEIVHALSRNDDLGMFDVWDHVLYPR